MVTLSYNIVKLHLLHHLIHVLSTQFWPPTHSTTHNLHLLTPTIQPLLLRLKNHFSTHFRTAQLNQMHNSLIILAPAHMQVLVNTSPPTKQMEIRNSTIIIDHKSRSNFHTLGKSQRLSL
jgi:hypothetical protein